MTSFLRRFGRGDYSTHSRSVLTRQEPKPFTPRIHWFPSHFKRIRREFLLLSHTLFPLSRYWSFTWDIPSAQSLSNPFEIQDHSNSRSHSQTNKNGLLPNLEDSSLTWSVTKGKDQSWVCWRREGGRMGWVRVLGMGRMDSNSLKFMLIWLKKD